MHITPFALIALTLCCGTVSAETEILVDLDISNNKPHIAVVEDGAVVTTYPIAAPKHTPSCLYTSDVYGTVLAIDPHATWTPTDRTRTDMARAGKHLKAQYGPNDPHNALGGRKLMIAWGNSCIPATVRVHGTIKPQLVRAQARASRGCIRMLNEHWDELARYITIGTRIRMKA